MKQPGTPLSDPYASGLNRSEDPSGNSEDILSICFRAEQDLGSVRVIHLINHPYGGIIFFHRYKRQRQWSVRDWNILSRAEGNHCPDGSDPESPIVLLFDQSAAHSTGKRSGTGCRPVFKFPLLSCIASVQHAAEETVCKSCVRIKSDPDLGQDRAVKAALISIQGKRIILRRLYFLPHGDK